jgi:hypothetical protein
MKRLSDKDSQGRVFDYKGIVTNAKEKLLLDIVERLCTLDMAQLIQVFGHRMGKNFYSLKCKYSPRDIVYLLTYKPKTNKGKSIVNNSSKFYPILIFFLIP